MDAKDPKDPRPVPPPKSSKHFHFLPGGFTAEKSENMREQKATLEESKEIGISALTQEQQDKIEHHLPNAKDLILGAAERVHYDERGMTKLSLFARQHQSLIDLILQFSQPTPNTPQVIQGDLKGHIWCTQSELKSFVNQCAKMKGLVDVWVTSIGNGESQYGLYVVGR